MRKGKVPTLLHAGTKQRRIKMRMSIVVMLYGKSGYLVAKLSDQIAELSVH